MSAWSDLYDAARQHDWYFSSQPRTPVQGATIMMVHGQHKIEVELTIRTGQVRYAHLISRGAIVVEQPVPGGVRGIRRLMRRLTIPR